jgi:hypothetical protein
MKTKRHESETAVTGRLARGEQDLVRPLAHPCRPGLNPLRVHSLKLGLAWLTVGAGLPRDSAELSRGEPAPTVLRSASCEVRREGHVDHRGLRALRSLRPSREACCL